MDEPNVSFKDFFIPLTNSKAIFWIVIIGIVVYANMLFNGFVWDDKTYVLTNSQLFGLDIPKLFGQNIFNSLGYYRPIPAVYFALLYSMFGQLSFFYHFPQLILHIANTVFVFLIFQSFFKKHLAFFLSLIFLVHPMQTESVGYIAQTECVLFFFFGTLALFINRGEKITYKKLSVTGVLLLVSLLTQESAIAFIFMLLLFRWIFAKGKLLMYTAMSIVTIAIYLFIRIGFAGISFYHSNFVPISQLSFPERFLNMPAITFYYLKTFFLPINLIIDQQWVVKTISFQNFYQPLFVDLLFLLLILVVGIVLFKQKSTLFRGYLFFVLWFVIGLGIHLQLIPLDLTVADRWFYFPMMGLLGMLGVAIEVYLLKYKELQKSIFVAFALILVIFSLRTMVRNTNWQNALTLYQHDAALTQSFDLEANLGQELYLGEQKDQALIHYQKSVQLLPFDRNYNNIGVIYEHEGNYQLAEVYYLKAIHAIDPMPPYTHQASLYENVARLLYYNGKPQESLKYIDQGLHIYPNDYLLYLLQGMDEAKLQEKDQALQSLQQASVLAPNALVRSIIQQVINNPQIQIPITDFE